MVEREASGDFDYLWDDPADADGLTSHDQAFEAGQAEELDHPPNDPGDDLWDEPADSFWDNQLDPDDPGHFDAFNDNTWSFKPAPTPWYRTRQAAHRDHRGVRGRGRDRGGGRAAGIPRLGEHRRPGDVVGDPDRTDERRAGFGGEQQGTATAARPTRHRRSRNPTTATTAPPPPPPPSETAASPVNPAPRYEAPPVQPRQTKGPEINVTRSPISVAPQPRGPHTGMH